MAEKYLSQLKRQLNFIKRSCEIFDTGEEDEAIRIAVHLRTIFHNTKSSTSLLKHLSAEDIKIITTSGLGLPPDKPNIRRVPGDPLTTFDEERKLIPAGFNGWPVKKPIPAPDWWIETVIILADAPEVSRKQIVLDAANKDGGAHVDKELPEYYKGLYEGFWLTYNGKDFEKKHPNHQLVVIRQIAFEVLNSPELTSLADI